MLILNAVAALPGERDFRRITMRILNGKILWIREAGSAGTGDASSDVLDERIDAKGLLMFPGAIDPHVHFDEPGFTHREDFLHGCAEAARGGVTTIIDMPCTSLPPVISPHALEQKLSVVKEKALIDYAFYGGIPGSFPPEAIQELVCELAERVVGFKCYFISGMETFPAVNDAQFSAAAQACAKVSRPLLL
ncbi:MAG: amidohydrolase family protein, partial [Rectinema sp.]|nr:amidohydrolase family protein [Rectinema sp.]